MHPILALSTSSSVLSVAAKKEGAETVEKICGSTFSHAEKFMPSVDHVLKKSRLKLTDIRTFLIDRGPGSFTGLRVGFSALKGFLAFEKKNCYGCLSLDMIAQNDRKKTGGKIKVVVDAYRQKIYTRVYRKTSGGPIPEKGLQVLKLEEIISDLSQNVYWVGNALARHQTFFKKYVDPNYFLPETFWYPYASGMISAFETAGKTGGPAALFQSLEHPHDFSPLYFRLSEAEEKREETVSRHADIR
jgi:tRNA threonylcarbamoyladenosine biosynthesis protein TsaB